MDTSRLRPGEILAAAGGAVLLVVLLLDWYGAEGGGLTAWQAFDVLDLWLALVAAGAIALAVLNAARHSPALPVAVAVQVTVAALLSLVFVAYRLLDQPGANDAVDVEGAAYAGLLATSAILFGAYKALQDESGRATPAPEVELRPAPPATAPVPEPPSKA